MHGSVRIGAGMAALGLSEGNGKKTEMDEGIRRGRRREARGEAYNG